MVYFNKMSEGEGHCVRIGGDEHDSDSNDSDEATDYGKNNEVNDYLRMLKVGVVYTPITVMHDILLIHHRESSIPSRGAPKSVG